MSKFKIPDDAPEPRWRGALRERGILQRQLATLAGMRSDSVSTALTTGAIQAPLADHLCRVLGWSLWDLEVAKRDFRAALSRWAHTPPERPINERIRKDPVSKELKARETSVEEFAKYAGVPLPWCEERLANGRPCPQMRAAITRICGWPDREIDDHLDPYRAKLSRQHRGGTR